jgi:hypothetical protein
MGCRHGSATTTSSRRVVRHRQLLGRYDGSRASRRSCSARCNRPPDTASPSRWLACAARARSSAVRINALMASSVSGRRGGTRPGPRIPPQRLHIQQALVPTPRQGRPELPVPATHHRRGRHAARPPADRRSHNTQGQPVGKYESKSGPPAAPGHRPMADPGGRLPQMIGRQTHLQQATDRQRRARRRRCGGQQRKPPRKSPRCRVSFQVARCRARARPPTILRVSGPYLGQSHGSAASGIGLHAPTTAHYGTTDQVKHFASRHSTPLTPPTPSGRPAPSSPPKVPTEAWINQPSRERSYKAHEPRPPLPRPTSRGPALGWASRTDGLWRPRHPNAGNLR